MSEPRYANIEVQLTGEDGNALSIIARVRSALRIEGVPQEELDEFAEQAMSGDYFNVITTCIEWVSVR